MSRDAAAFSLRRLIAMMRKEFLQLGRDRGSIGMMIVMPIMQLLLFGYAIETQPRHLPTVLLMGEQTSAGRAILGALQNTRYIDFKRVVASPEELDHAILSGEALFAVEIPVGFERKLRRGERPAILVVSDATDPVASSSAIAAATGTVQTALARERFIDTTDASASAPYEIRVHRRFNPSGETPLNIVPGLLGVILTMSTLVFTALAVTRETERGTMETLLAMPISPVEIMLGKIAPYVVVGFGQMAVVLVAGALAFKVPIIGSLTLLIALSTLFLASNLSLGYLISTVTTNQLQALQLSFGVFMPNILLSGFMFPFAGMPKWAQAIGEALPLTHYLRIVRGIMLKGAVMVDLRFDVLAMTAFMVAVMALAVFRFRQTLD
ncbi:ABC transporter permease [Terrarubrum flagellatum]|uniref:ABC transporter permease n=1 Tax=Terrirubrum flagellatum TaxID=2895980 RepID=UPI0031454F9E